MFMFSSRPSWCSYCEGLLSQIALLFDLNITDAYSDEKKKVSMVSDWTNIYNQNHGIWCHNSIIWCHKCSTMTTRNQMYTWLPCIQQQMMFEVLRIEADRSIILEMFTFFSVMLILAMYFLMVQSPQVKDTASTVLPWILRPSYRTTPYPSKGQISDKNKPYYIHRAIPVINIFCTIFVVIFWNEFSWIYIVLYIHWMSLWGPHSAFCNWQVNFGLPSLKYSYALHAKSGVSKPAIIIDNCVVSYSLFLQICKVCLQNCHVQNVFILYCIWSVRAYKICTLKQHRVLTCRQNKHTETPSRTWKCYLKLTIETEIWWSCRKMLK